MALRLSVVLCTVLSFFVSVWPAYASEAGGYSFYLTPAASYYRVDLPEYAPIALRDGNALEKRLTTEDGEMSGPLMELTAGWKVHDYFGQDRPMVLEARFFYSSLSHDNSEVFDFSDAYRVGWYPIDGNHSGVGFFGGDDVAARTDRDVTQYGGELLLGMEVPVSDAFRVMPYIGYSAMYIDQEFDTYAYEVQDPTNYMNLQEDVTATYHGITCGVRLTHVTEKVESYLSGSGAAHYVYAKYDGSQVETAIPYQASQSDTSEKVSFRGRVEGGIAYLLGAWKLGLTGGLEYNSYVPQIMASDKGTFGVTQDGETTRVVGDDSLAWNVGLQVSYLF